MANVILIGATGFVGSAVLNELVERGHHVTAVVRNAAKLSKSSQVEAAEADVADVEKVADLARGKDAIISAYNPGWANPDIKRLIDELSAHPRSSEAERCAPTDHCRRRWYPLR